MLKTMDDAKDSMSPPEKSFRNKFQFYTGVETPGQAMAVHEERKKQDQAEERKRN